MSRRYRIVRESNLTKALLHACEKGYSITREGKLKNPKGELLKGTVSSRGYRKTTINFPVGKCTTLYFHRLVAYQKYGDAMFKEGIEVRHLNNDKLDNSFDNIAIGTRSDNLLDIPEDQRKANMKKASAAGASAAAAMVLKKLFRVISPEGKEYITEGGLNAFCREHGLHQGNMSLVASGRRPHHRGWKCNRIGEKNGVQSDRTIG